MQENQYQQPNPLVGELRKQRSIVLSATDWTQMPDAPLSAEKKLAWSEYRQAWRDITSQSGFPDNVVIPTPPGLND